MTTNSARSDSFHAVGEQVTATLHDAHLALESYVEGDAGPQRLQQCAELLHAARGALQVLEVYGASLLAEEMESTCAFLLETQDEGISDEGVEALSRAMVQLPAYVERIMSGGKDIPLVLLPLLNDLRAARSKPLLSESTLLLLNLEPAGGDAGQQPERQPSGENIDQLVGKLRPQFQLGLLGWIKDSASQEDLRRMANVAERLEGAATTDEVHQLWWVTGGVLEALAAGGLDASIALKRLIGQADREIKRLQQTGESEYSEDAPVSLVNNLLYYIARSTSGGERCEAIRAAFNMSDVAPGDEQVEEVREALSAPSPKLMKTVADAIREDLAKAKDVLDIYVRTGMQDNTELQPQIALLHKISDTLGVLGLGALREVVQARGDELEQIVASQEEPQESRLIGLAAALLEVEGRLDADLMSLIRQRSDGEPQEFDETGFDEVTGAVMRECIVNLAHIKEAVTQILAHPEDIKALDGIDDQLRGIGAGLMMLGKARAVQLLTRIGESIRQSVQNGAVVADPTSINRLADSIVSLEYYMETLKAGRKEPDYMLDNAERSLDVLESDQVIPLPQDEVADVSYSATLKIDTAHLEQLPDIPPEVAGAAEVPIVVPADEPEKTSVLDTPVLITGDHTPDPELLELFIEEAKEEVAAVRRHFPAWVENQIDEEALITVRRSFHTLKGSGRMVGAARIGDYSWNIENLLNKIINKTVDSGPAVSSLLGEAIDALPQLLEQLEVGTEPTADIETISNDAIAFGEGTVPERFAQLAEPEPETEEPVEVDILLEEEPAAVAGVDPVLLEILARETRGHVAAVRKFLSDCILDSAPYAISEEMHRACHTLHGSVTMADVAEAATLTGPLHQIVERLYRENRGLVEEDLTLVAAAADGIEAVIASFGEAAESAPDTTALAAALIAAAEKYAAEADDDTGITLLDSEPGFSEETIGIEVLRDTTAMQPEMDDVADETAHIDSDDTALVPQPDFDAEIAAIFTEEAAEILSAADAAMISLAADQSSLAPLDELQRHLHTLKGGARMAGVVVMGDFSHELESLLMRISQGGMGLDDAAYDLLQSSIDELHRMREQVLRGFVTPPEAGLMARLAGVVEATMLTPALLDPDAMAPPPVEEPAAAAETGADESVTQDLVEEGSLDEDSDSDDTAEHPLVPEPELLGELARELTSEPPQRQQADDQTATMATPQIPDVAQHKEMARVESAMLEDLLNNAGEISIFHSRLNQQVSSIQFNLVELGQTVQRLQQQLRLLEIETEAQILHRHQTEAASDEEFDPLELDRYSTIQQLSRGLAETASDVSSIKDLLQNVAADTESILAQQARTTSELQDNLMRTRMVPFDHHVPRLSRLVRQQALESEKQVELVVEGSSGELDRQVMEKMLPPLEHMLRNAVIHGIEASAIREQAGKAADARITIRFRREGSQVLIDIIDDGAGLNLQAILHKAVEQGVVKTDQKMTDEEVTQLILRSGLSTAGKLTQSAGRGIGMDVVISEIAKLGGTLAIETATGKGCTFTVRLPYTLAITQAFIVKIGPEVFALPLPTVEGVVRLPRREFDERLQLDNPIIEYGGRSYALRHLGMYLGLGPATIHADEEQVSVILVDAGESSTALIVDETADSREVVVKPIGPQLAAIRGIAGATILGDGRIVVILDPGSLVRGAQPDSMDMQPAVFLEEDLPALALVVDDSITMRRVTQRLLERNGMRVITAKDGVEALEVLQENRPEIIVLDIEMPRMDGYEFAGHVRNKPETAELPIIMVTSRTGEKHRARAIELGINDYLGKPYQEHEMLDAIRNLLGEDFSRASGSRQTDRVV